MKMLHYMMNVKVQVLDTAFETIDQGIAFTCGIMKGPQEVQCYKNEIIFTSDEIQSKYYMQLHFKDC